ARRSPVAPPRAGFANAGSQRSLQRCFRDVTFQTRDRAGRRQMLRTALGAADVRMASEAAGVASDCTQALELRRVALILNQSPGAIERGRAEVLGKPGHHVAGAIAHAATDAFNTGFDLAPRFRLRRNAREILAARRA